MLFHITVQTRSVFSIINLNQTNPNVRNNNNSKVGITKLTMSIEMPDIKQITFQTEWAKCLKIETVLIFKLLQMNHIIKKSALPFVKTAMRINNTGIKQLH